MEPVITTSLPPLRLPDAPVVVAGLVRFVWLGPDGEIEEIDSSVARARLGQRPPLLVYGPSLARRLDIPRFPAFDLLELFAFARPAKPCLPTPRGLATALGLPVPHDAFSTVSMLRQAAMTLLAEIRRAADPTAAAALEIMAKAGWLWAPTVGAALAGVFPSPDGTAVWRGLSEIRDDAPPPPPGSRPVDPAAARRRLIDIVGNRGESRLGQVAYAGAVAAAFQPRDVIDTPHVVLAEAGTGVGKTLGYLAPASLWAEANGGAVWVSTYTRNLQHQIDGELDRLYPSPAEKAVKAVVRKGRENYLCLLNLDDALRALPTRPTDGVALGLMTRWTAATAQGDLTGGDLPGWLVDIAGINGTIGLADRRGECIYTACTHFSKCFVERGIRLARHAHIVVANHALVLMQAALGAGDDANAAGGMPTRLVFDEGHHLFDAADSAFSAELSGAEGQELRRWLLGAEGGRSRMRGLRRRVEDLIADGVTAQHLIEALAAAQALPGEGWTQRLGAVGGEPQGPVERFLAALRDQLLGRAGDNKDGQALECDARPLTDAVAEAAVTARAALERLLRPLQGIRKGILQRLVDEAEDLDTNLRQRIEAMGRSLDRRAILPLAGWIAMLKSLPGELPEAFVDWFAMGPPESRGFDIGMHRHWIDPGRPFAEAVATPAHGIIVTSATLTDAGSGLGTAAEESDEAWAAAETRTGMRHLREPPKRFATISPFDYINHTRVFVVTDVRRDDLGQVAAAYRALFLAARGGALGLFTAIRRLRAVHTTLARALESAGIPLYAQHVDGMETSQLIDIFRAEEDACLLGTDAVRDGVDVPGRSLRLIVFDRVPWPRPDILHKARRAAFGGTAYDDMLTRLRLKQAFGRLVRRADDRGCFVLLDSRMPTRLATAFPPGVEVTRLGLAATVAAVAAFLGDDGA